MSTIIIVFLLFVYNYTNVIESTHSMTFVLCKYIFRNKPTQNSGGVV